MKILSLILLAYSLFAGTYDNNYKIQAESQNISTKLDTFMYGDFKEIIRFEMLNFEDGKLSDSNKTNYVHIVKTIKEYKQKKEKILVKIIGHINEPTDDHNEIKVDSDTYANAIQNYFRYSLDANTSKELSRDYANAIQEALIGDDIAKEILVLEYRGGNDMAYTDATDYGRDLSNRVMVTIYVEFPKDIDSDKDGVFDATDRCLGTPRGAGVDSKGCPIDSDKDGVLDHKDNCPETPVGVSVDSKGCPIDSDGDGVVDYKDRCPDTPEGVGIDLNGCPLNKSLALNFKSNSDKILENSYDKVVKFAIFLKQNPAYNAEIIGHTDSSGDSEKNMTLSQRRAASTKAALVSEGVDESRLVSKGRGELDPIESNRTVEGRKVNRRIEVKLSYSK